MTELKMNLTEEESSSIRRLEDLTGLKGKDLFLVAGDLMRWATMECLLGRTMGSMDGTAFKELEMPALAAIAKTMEGVKPLDPEETRRRAASGDARPLADIMRDLKAESGT